jgi:hypothetical protein
MKHKILSIIGAGLLILTFGSCREQSDTLMNYSRNDQLAFAEAENSYAGKFKVLWNALNQNYALWDYEAAHGLDWDAVYDMYLPKFEALDQQKEVTDDQLEELIEEVVCPLHEGHMAVKVKNHKTGEYISVMPSKVRNSERPEYLSVLKFSPTLKYYAKKENGEIELDEEDKPVYLEYSTAIEDLLDQFNDTEKSGRQWINDSIKVLKNLTTPTAEQVDMLQALTELCKNLDKVEDNAQGIQLFNMLAVRYAYLNIPGFEPIEEKFNDNGMKIKFALLKGNIAYLYFSDFALVYYLDEQVNKETFSDPSDAAKAHIKKVQEVWNYWFNSIQYLHKNGKLGGVIIDVRNNGGGAMADNNYVLGALLPSGGFEYGKVRYKRGTGRLDYSPLLPQVIGTMENEHAIITEPIVVLANCRSVSMAEITSLSTKYIDNATLIGKRTSGGLCGLMDSEYYSYNYSGHIGEDNKTPVYVYLPFMAQFTREGQILEGIGVTPDIEVDLDSKQHRATGQDSQLDRALQYIRNGK